MCFWEQTNRAFSANDRNWDVNDKTIQGTALKPASRQASMYIFFLSVDVIMTLFARYPSVRNRAGVAKNVVNKARSVDCRFKGRGCN